MDKLLQKIYYDPENEGSFGGIDKLYKKAIEHDPSITRDDVKEWLSEQLTYTLHKQVVRKYKRNPIIVTHINKQWEADLVDMKEFSNKNKGFNYILTVIDCFSKYAFAEPIKQKSADLITKAFKDIFKERKPSYLRTDKGKEFINSKLKTLLKENQIKHFTSNDEIIKCAIVERFNRTLKGKMFKYFTSKGTRRYIDVLPALIASYNNSYHRSIKMKPIEVCDENEKIVFKNIYGYDTLRDLILANKTKAKIKSGDKVRMAYTHKPFDKGYYPNWTDNIFTVEKSIKGEKQYVFRLKDEKGNIVEQRFYPQEIQKIKENLFRVEKVIKERQRRGMKEVLVKWLNYPSSYNSWIPKTELKKL
jgi:hypothetical protein